MFPAAIAPTAGPSVSANGKFHAPMISTVPYGSYSTQPRPGSCDISSRRWRRFAHLPTFFAAYAVSPLVLATSASHASNGRPPQVFLQGVGDLGLVLDHQPLERAQLLLAPLQIAGSAGGKCLA